MSSECHGAVTPAAAWRCCRPRTLGLAAIFSALVGCSETSLNEAPIIDLSVPAGARSAPARSSFAAVTPAPGEVLYTVQKGDTLFHLAANAHCSVAELARWNGIDEKLPLHAGQQLRLQPPAADSAAATATSGGMAAESANAADSSAVADAVATPIPLAGSSSVETRALDAVPGGAAPAYGNATASSGTLAASASPQGGAPGYATSGTTGTAGASAGTGGAGSSTIVTADVAAANMRAPVTAVGAAVASAPRSSADSGGGLMASAPASAAAIGWIWPVEGPVTGKFDPVHSKGIEIAAPEDAPVLAVADGTVSYTGSPRDYGNLVILKHGDTLLSVYAHNKTILVKEGQLVQRGQEIATAGKSATGPATLHFEARRNHIPVDPLELLPLR